jgi:hypothetical protein
MPLNRRQKKMGGRGEEVFTVFLHDREELLEEVGCRLKHDLSLAPSLRVVHGSESVVKHAAPPHVCRSRFPRSRLGFFSGFCPNCRNTPPSLSIKSPTKKASGISSWNLFLESLQGEISSRITSWNLF